ncbi:hypothetical protein INS49_004641 [Diaporthe citri]|uniref:uncharacterized protein n=1 Tax=Diaporthe citri TaxID=83186 RepID=UPI001C827CE7|nr:uncharacterized protein INS49_004641 [Diaporthe citri]KAG6354623.1 hypothetical protein INS49_004641 [Diaporthe citri]
MALPIGAVRVVVMAFVGSSLALLAFALRLWSRYIQRAPLAFHDWIAFEAGIGYDVVDLLKTHPDVFATYSKLATPCRLLWAAANTAVKVSVLELYMALFPGLRFRRMCYSIMALTFLYLIFVILQEFVFCRPVKYNWDQSIPGYCDVDGQRIAFAFAGGTNLVIDATVVALPMPKILRLKMSLRKRLSIVSMFSFGVLICIISLLRVFALSQWDPADGTFASVNVLICTILEQTLGVVNSCLPTIKPAILAIAGRKPDRLNNSPKHSGPSFSNRIAVHRNGRQNLDTDIPLSEFERLDDEYPLTNTHVEREDVLAPRNRGEITVEHR